MKREPQESRTTPNRRRKNQGRAELGTSGTPLQDSFRDRRNVFDRIANGKSPIANTKLTPLTTIRSYIFTIMERHNLRRTPLKMTGKKGKRNTNIFCSYHRDIRHEIENCNDLKKIKNLLK